MVTLSSAFCNLFVFFIVAEMGFKNKNILQDWLKVEQEQNSIKKQQHTLCFCP